MGRCAERGSALVVVILVSSLLQVLGAMLVLSALSETYIAAHVRDGIESLHAADAGLERAVVALEGLPDWDAALAGAAASVFVDGAPGVRHMADGTVVDLNATTNRMRCGMPAGCSDASMQATTGERPWGRNNPRWQLFAYGPVRRIVSSDGVDSTAYVVVWLADDPSENDGNPLADGGDPERIDASNLANMGRGVVRLTATAYGPGTARRTLEATVVRAGPPLSRVRTMAWGEIR